MYVVFNVYLVKFIDVIVVVDVVRMYICKSSGSKGFYFWF